MSAAAAPARRPAHSQNGQENQDRLPGWVVESGYTTIPNIVIDRLMRCLTYTEFGIVLILLRETVGAKGRPEWARITEQELADAKGVSAQEASESLKSLELRKGLIESRKVGRGRQYRVVPERLSLVEERKPRTIEPKSEPRTVGSKEKFTFDASQPTRAAFEEPASEIELVAAKDSPGFSVERSMSGSVPRFVIGLQPEAITPVTPSGGRTKVQTITGVMVSDPKVEREKELRGILTPVFLDLFHRKPDDLLLHQVQRELKDASVEHYGRLIHKRIRHNTSQIKSGLFVVLAREAADAAAEIARRQPEPPPPPKPSLFVPEPEHSTSPWAKIRREASQHVTPEEYGNWFVRSRHGRLDVRSNELTVLVPDDVTAEMLSQEYELRLMRWALKAGFPLNKIFFKVAEENS
jgi:hypothetical protein